MFLKVTELTEGKIFINSDLIVTISQSENGSDIHTVEGGGYYEVKELPSKIFEDLLRLQNAVSI